MLDRFNVGMTQAKSICELVWSLYKDDLEMGTDRT